MRPVTSYSAGLADTMVGCGADRVRDLFAQGQSMPEFYRNEWFTGKVYKKFFPNDKPSTLWRSLPTMLEAISRRIP
eukprot:3586404-Alexandrium_andersonii.AAC.1